MAADLIRLNTSGVWCFFVFVFNPLEMLKSIGLGANPH